MAKKTTALAGWDEEIAKAAEEAAKQEAGTGGGGQFFSIKGGNLSLGGAQLPGNEVVAIVLDGILANALYGGKYQEGSPTSPTCYAFGRDEDTIKPHADAPEPVSEEGCAVCPNNAFGTAETGGGKACKNNRRLALIAGGTINQKTGEFEAYDDPAHFEQEEIAYLMVPPTSLKAYANYVKQLYGVSKLPPFGVFTRVSVKADPYPVVSFENLGELPRELRQVVLARHKEARAAIEFPYPKAEERAERQASRKPVARAPAKPALQKTPGARPSSGARQAATQQQQKPATARKY